MAAKETSLQKGMELKDECMAKALADEPEPAISKNATKSKMHAEKKFANDYKAAIPKTPENKTTKVKGSIHKVELDDGGCELCGEFISEFIPIAKLLPFQDVVNDNLKYIEQFGCERITQDVLDKMKKIIGQPAHYMLRRGVFPSNRGLNALLDLHDRKLTFFVYLRCTLLEELTLGHLVPIIFSKWVQDTFEAPVLVHFTLDEKCVGARISYSAMDSIAQKNMELILAMEFDAEKTFVFTDFDELKNLRRVSSRIGKRITYERLEQFYSSLNEMDTIGLMGCTTIRSGPFSNCYPQIFGLRSIPCLVPCRLLEDPFFQISREVATELKLQKPVLVHSLDLPAFHGINPVPGQTIRLSDDLDEIKNKIRLISKFPDVAWQHLFCFVENEDKFEELNKQWKASSESFNLESQLTETILPLVEKLKWRRESIISNDIQRYRRPNRIKVEPCDSDEEYYDSMSSEEEEEKRDCKEMLMMIEVQRVLEKRTKAPQSSLQEVTTANRGGTAGGTGHSTGMI